MANLLGAVVSFPEGGGIQGLVYGLIKALYNNGAIAYGVAIILFVLIFRAAFLPLDFGVKYFTKKNAAAQAELKPELDRLKAQYGNDMQAYNRAQQEVYRKNGYSMVGFCLMQLVNMVVMITVFFSVFAALRNISNFNINNQYKELQAVYLEYEERAAAEGLKFYDLDENASEDDKKLREEFIADINGKFEETRVGFLWVYTIWQPDTWASKTLDWSKFKSTVEKTQGTVFADDAGKKVSEVDLKLQYERIMEPVAAGHSGWNGWLLLVLLAGVATYLSSILNSMIMKKTVKPQTAKEIEVGYSMRDAKRRSDLPQVDPQAVNNMMNKVMKFAMPVVMIIFTVSSTAALAIYIISNSIILTGVTLGLNYIVELILRKQAKRKKEVGDTDETVINPHAKYFKKKRTGK